MSGAHLYLAYSRDWEQRDDLVTLDDGRRFSLTVLRAAFQRVQDCAKWDEPIDATLPRGTSTRTLDLVTTAIWYFTASTPVLELTPQGIRVRSTGYRYGPRREP